MTTRYHHIGKIEPRNFKIGNIVRFSGGKLKYVIDVGNICALMTNVLVDSLTIVRFTTETETPEYWDLFVHIDEDES